MIFSKIINHFPPKLHYKGWNFIIDRLKESISIKSGYPVLNTFVECSLQKQDADLPKDKWMGILHSTLDDLHKTISNENFLNSYEYCIGLITLSKDTKDYLSEKLDIPIFHTTHPKGCDGNKFNINAVFSSEGEQKLMHSGFHKRNLKKFVDFPTSLKKNISFAKHWHLKDAEEVNLGLNQLKELGIDCSFGFASNKNYIHNLISNISFSYFENVAASNGVLEHIMTGTPLVTNKLPANIEYLGEDYPFFIESIEHNPDSFLRDKDIVSDCSSYLNYLSKQNRFTVNHFVNFFKNLGI